VLQTAQRLTVSHRSRRDGAFGANGGASAPVEKLLFTFARVLGPTASQAEVFHHCASDAVSALLDGYHACVMTYGQTGAGKTHTMTGGGAAFDQRGLAPRALSAIFRALAARGDGGASTTVRVGFVELYNEQWGDLLRPSTPSSALHVQEVVSPSGGPDSLMLSSQTMRLCTCEEDALDALFEGQRNRAVGEHALNRASSRSHAIFTVFLEQREPAGLATGVVDLSGDGPGGAPARVVHSKLHLVDLAGSERLLKTRSEGQVAQEAKHINKSLSFLEQTVLALSEQAGHVPYRSSKLTHLLKDALGGNCKTVLIANVWGTRDQVDETLSTCRFAQRMACVTVLPRRNVVEDPAVTIARLRRTITTLRSQLTGTQLVAGAAGGEGGDAAWTPLDAPADEAGLEERVRAFMLQPLDGVDGGEAIRPADVLGPASTPGAAFALAYARTLLLDLRQEWQAAAALLPVPRLTSDTAAHAPQMPRPSDPAQTVVLPADEPLAASQLEVEATPIPEAPVTPPPPPPPPPAEPVDEAAVRDAAFEQYKSGPGQEATALLAHNKAAVKDAKRAAKALAERCNAAKLDIDSLKAGPPDEDATSAEQRKARLGAAKKVYKAAHDELTMVKSDADYASSLVEACARDLVAGFEVWFAEQRSEAQYAAPEPGVPSPAKRTASPAKGRAASPQRTPKAPPPPPPPSVSADPAEAAYQMAVWRAQSRSAASHVGQAIGRARLLATVR
jgi:kinesin family protein 6/9